MGRRAKPVTSGSRAPARTSTSGSRAGARAATQPKDSSTESPRARPPAATKGSRAKPSAATKAERPKPSGAKKRPGAKTGREGPDARASTDRKSAKPKKGERRQYRSQDPQRALAIQLSQVRDEACLDALVLATHDGLTIAHAGDPAVCTELAALAPLLSRGPLLTEIELTQQLLFVRAVTFEGSPLYLATCGDDPDRITPADVDSWLAKATLGVTRILAAA